MRRLRSLAFLLLAGTVSCSHPAAPDPAPAAADLAAAAARVPRQQKVIVVVLENEDSRFAEKAPYLRELAQRGAILGNYRAVTHPSQPNYVAMISGSTHSVRTDRPVDLEGRHLGDLLEDRGLTWKVYAEGYPGDCYTAADRHTPQGDYVRRHVPFLDFTNVSRNAARCNAHIVDATQFDGDLAAGALPAFALYIPTNRHNGHDTGLDVADAWLRSRFDPVLRNPAMRDVLLIVTFDESDRDPLNRVATILVGNRVNPGARSDAIYDHYSLLRTIEAAAGLPTLGARDATAVAIHDVWR